MNNSKSTRQAGFEAMARGNKKANANPAMNGKNNSKVNSGAVNTNVKGGQAVRRQGQRGQ
ncbi:MAG: hypothetical protein IJS80_04540 [Lachnospiraceae bacterium]|nr:hypothetical protein [Lachnospiraceae bacterium]